MSHARPPTIDRVALPSLCLLGALAGCGLPGPEAPGCTLLSSEIVGLDELPEGMDHGLGEALEPLTGEFSGEASWAEGGSSSADLLVELDGEGKLLRYDPPELCPPTWSAPVALMLTTDDGRLAESAPSSLILPDIGQGSFRAVLPEEELLGSMEPASLDPEELSDLQLELAGVGEPYQWTVSIQWYGREIAIEDDTFEVDEQTEAVGTLVLNAR